MLTSINAYTQSGECGEQPNGAGHTMELLSIQILRTKKLRQCFHTDLLPCRSSSNVTRPTCHRVLSVPARLRICLLHVKLKKLCKFELAMPFRLLHRQTQHRFDDILHFRSCKSHTVGSFFIHPTLGEKPATVRQHTLARFRERFRDRLLPNEMCPSARPLRVFKIDTCNFLQTPAIGTRQLHPCVVVLELCAVEVLGPITTPTFSGDSSRLPAKRRCHLSNFQILLPLVRLADGRHVRKLEAKYMLQ